MISWRLIYFVFHCTYRLSALWPVIAGISVSDAGYGDSTSGGVRVQPLPLGGTDSMRADDILICGVIHALTMAYILTPYAWVRLRVRCLTSIYALIAWTARLRLNHARQRTIMWEVITWISCIRPTLQ